MKLPLLTKIFFNSLVFFFGAIALLNAQPVSVSIESATLYQHGRNSGGIDPDELIDSVTIGSTTKYYILPDAAVNAGFNVVADPFANVISTFNWTVPVALAAGQDDEVPAYLTETHYKQVTWTGLGTGTISVTETSDISVGGCTSDAVNTDVEVIAAPDVDAITFSAISCPTGIIPYTMAGPTATLNILCSVNGNKGISLNWSLTCSNTAWNGGITLNGTANLGNNNTIDLSGINLSHPGIYTLTIENITDRIALKSGLSAITDGTAGTFLLLPTPSTNPLFHVTNSP